MTRKYITLLMILAVTACQGNKVELDAPYHDDVMRFNIVTPGAQTKVSSGSFEVADRIGLYITDYVDETTPRPLQVSGNRVNNSVVTFDGANWISEQTVYWGTGKSDVYAYYPYFEKVLDVNALTVCVADDQAVDGCDMSDFLWARTDGVSQAGGAVTLNMKHIMSKLTVKIVAGEDYVGSLPEDASVLLHNTVTSAIVNLEDGTAVKDPYMPVTSIKMRNLGKQSYGDVEAVVYEAVVVPQMLEDNVPFIEINSKSVSYLIEDDFNFHGGVAYTYTVTMNTSTTAIKVQIGCELEDWNDGSNGGGTGDDEGETEPSYIDLSANGNANCYLVTAPGKYGFKALLGNTGQTVGDVRKVKILWESFGTDVTPSVGDIVSSVSYDDGYIQFAVPENFKEGNAVIAAMNAKGVMLWSWHIWVSSEGWKEQVYYNDAGVMMDRNLGALSAIPGDVTSFGLLYQWGRKDPFLGSSSVDTFNPVASTGEWFFASDGSWLKTELNPTTSYRSLSMSDDSWTPKKAYYDPCPAGWKVPDGGTSGIWARALGVQDTQNAIVGGIDFSGILGDDKVIWYPACGYGYLGNLELEGVGRYGCYWACDNLYGFGFPSNMGNYGYGMNPSYLQSVRCQKE